MIVECKKHKGIKMLKIKFIPIEQGPFIPYKWQHNLEGCGMY